MRITTEGLTPLALGRLNKELNKVYKWDNGTYSLRQHLEEIPNPVKTVTDNTGNFNRRHFNSLVGSGKQEAYEAHLKAAKRYFIGDVQVPKVVYDAVEV